MRKNRPSQKASQNNYFIINILDNLFNKNNKNNEKLL